MRSYYEHLQTGITTPGVTIATKSVFRSSAIFPVLQVPGISSRILFMGYWILKRNIKQIAAQINLRAKDGALLFRSSLLIDEAKTYRIELKDELIKAGINSESPFMGSLEVEFFSTVNMFFPFPATVINYYGPHFSSVVHTAQRVYNDFEDLKNNSKTKVKEAGFNIYADLDHEPFFSIVNGPEGVKNSKIDIDFYNYKNEKYSKTITYENINPYEALFIYPDKESDLEKFLLGQAGTAKIRFDLPWVFPRLVVGNIEKSLPAITITHSYYDCSSLTEDSNYWIEPQKDWHPASLMIPLTLQKEDFTSVYFYPIYSPSKVLIDVEIYNTDGELLGKKENCLELSKGYNKIPYKEICKELNIDDNQDLASRILAKTLDGTRIPARIKLGLDLGSTEEKMPCNICTNLQPFNPSLENKPSTFRWGPVLADRPKSTLWLMNSSPHVIYKREAVIEVTFFREQDTNTIKRVVTLEPHGFLCIHIEEDKELTAFFDKNVGWYTAVSTNPYTTTYYFTEDSSGVVGGDHGF